MRKRSRAVWMPLLLILAAACSEAATTEVETSEPWNTQFLFGNTSINTGEILTHQQSATSNVLSDYVLAADLPNTELELFITHVYLPVVGSPKPRVSNVTMRAQATDGTRTPNFFKSTRFVQSSVVSGQTYDVHRLEGLFLDFPILRPSNFAKVTFTFTVEYVGSTGGVLNSSEKTIEIVKR